jgi:hypothetical protein
MNMLSGKIRRNMTRVIRLLARAVLYILLMILMVLVALQFPVVQTYIAGRIAAYISKETGAVVSIERVAIRIPVSAELRGIYIEDPEGDTLLHAGRIYTDIMMTALLRNRLHINSLEIEDLTAFIIRDKPDTVFNFQFLADAFSGDPGNNRSGDNDPANQSGARLQEMKAAENDDNAPREDESSLSLYLNRVAFRNIRIRFEDHFSGTHLNGHLGYLQTTLDGSELLNARYHAGNTVIRESNIQLVAYEPSMPVDEPDEEMPDPDISLASLEITDFRFSHQSQDGGRLILETSFLDLIPGTINLKDQLVEISSLRSENLNASIISPPGHVNARGDEENEISRDDMELKFRFSEIMEWTAELGSLELSNSFFRVGPENAAPSKEAFDPDNFSLDRVNLSAKNIFVDPGNLRIDLDELNMTVSDTFRLDHMGLDINLGTESAGISLLMQTAGSSIGLALDMDANLLDFKAGDLFERNMLLVIDGTRINRDLAFFLPVMNAYYFNWPDTGPVEITSRITGSPAEMTIDSLRLTGPEVFMVFVQGDVAGLPESDNPFLDLREFELWAIPGVFMANLPDMVAPEGISLPHFIHAEGRFRGTQQEFETAILLNSDLGALELTAAMNGSPGQENFEGRLHSGSFDIARLLQMDFFQQPLSLDLDFRGRGLEPETMELDAGLTVGQLMVLDYAYDDIRIGLALTDSVATITTGYEDESLAMDLVAAVGLFKEELTAGGVFTLDYAMLGQLGISEDELLVSTGIDADIILFPDDFFSGNITVSAINMAIGEGLYIIPEMQIISDSRPEDYNLEIISEFISAVYKGNFSPAGIPQSMTDHLSEYFTVHDSGEQENNGSMPAAGEEIAEATVEQEDKNFNLEMHVYPNELINMVLVPAVEEYDTLSVFINYSSSDHVISLNAVMEEIQYSGMQLRNFEARISSDPEKMDFGIFLESLSLDQTTLYDLGISGSFLNETLDFAFSFKDDLQQDIFLIGGLLESREELYHFSIDHENLILNYENWQIHPDNLVVTGQKHLQFNNFIMEHGESMLSISGRDPREHEYDDITDIFIRQLDIHGITGFADNILPLRGGIIDGEMTLRDIYGETSFTADMVISNLEWAEYRIEMISLHAEDAGPGHIIINAAMEHQETALHLSGDYFPGEDPRVALELVMDNIDMQLIEMFAGDEITDVSGIITGKINIEGSLSSPVITGEMNFSGAGFRVTQLNAVYYLKDEQIIFDRHRVMIDNFTIEDSFGRTAGINGSVNIEDFNNLVFNINFSTSNFQLMDLPARRGEMFYGTIIMDSDLRLRGSHLSPSVTGRLRLREGSTFSFIVPQTAPEAIGGEGVVEFISPDQEDFHRLVIGREEPDEFRSAIEIMEISLNIELDRETELRVIIDEVAGDYLELQGGGMLTFGIDPGGAITLTGRYEIVEGEYMLSFHEVARRRFSIREGSNIIFTGDLMEAELEITAIHEVRTSGNELLRPVHGDQPRGERGTRQFPFLVYLNMQGELMSPDISFALDMPPEHRGAMDGSLMARINAINEDESELNKQVFALLILGSFIHESPFAAGGGPGIAATARSSASQILSQQLNRLSDRYVRGVDITFDLESYEVNRADEAVGRTELQVEVSRDFFDDRVRVVVGGNIELEDDTHRETRPGDIAGDFMLEYMVTPGGNLLLRGFRTREYGDLIEGELTTTGVSLVFSRSFTRFRDLFRRLGEENGLPDPGIEAGIP